MTQAAISAQQEPVEAFVLRPELAVAVSDACDKISHNLNGQKLGRKGKITRERILAATLELLAEDLEEPITLTMVARRSSLGMSSLYNYFNDLTELLLAVLEPVMATAEDSYQCMLRTYWSDEELGARCYEFLVAYNAFWERNTRLLHLRNSMADSRDDRMFMHRISSTQPMIALLAAQIDPPESEAGSPAFAMATVLMTGIERTITVATDRRFARFFPNAQRRHATYYLEPEARLMELAIRDTRANLAQQKA